MAVALLDDTDAPAWLLERCWSTPPDLCWIWTGSRKDRHRGGAGDQAMVARDGRRGNVGRVLYEEFLEVELPRSLIIEHSCDNAMCVRPSHLLLSTPRQNTARMVRRGRARPGGMFLGPTEPRRKPRRVVLRGSTQVS